MCGYSNTKLLPLSEIFPSKEEVIAQYNELGTMLIGVDSWWKLKTFKSKHREIPIRVIGTYCSYPDILYVVNFRYKNILATIEYKKGYMRVCDLISVHSNSGRIQFKYCKYDRFDKHTTGILNKNKIRENCSWSLPNDDDLPF